MQLPIDLHRGGIYPRSSLHQALGGPPTGRISPSARYPLILIFPPEDPFPGECWGDDGFYHLVIPCSEDREMNHRALVHHARQGKALALFGAAQDGCRFGGFFSYVKHRPTEGQVTYFLVPWDAVTIETLIKAPRGEINEEGILVLRRLAHEAIRRAPISIQDYMERSARVTTYVLARASGFCELCGMAAPFLDDHGTPYLEPHHLQRPHDGAPDPPDAVAALCPGCHRRLHHAPEARSLEEELLSRLGHLERALAEGTLKRVVAAILVNDAGRIYLAQRARGSLAGHWEFPGGKAEAQETLRVALDRELAEELKVQLHWVTPFMRVDYQYPDFFLRMFSFTATTSQRPHLTEHQAAQWVEPSRLKDFNWAPADWPIVFALTPFPIQPRA